jgi:hypothetical protein
MRAIAIAAIVTMIACTAFCAEDKFCVIDKEPKATEPVGAVVETAGVFVGKIASATEIAFTGERKLTVENETGECKIFPFCATTKVADETFHAVTFNQLKKGEKVKIEYKDNGGVAKTEKVTIESSAEKATPATATK